MQSLSKDSTQLSSNVWFAGELNKLKNSTSRKFSSFKSRIFILALLSTLCWVGSFLIQNFLYVSLQLKRLMVILTGLVRNVLQTANYLKILVMSRLYILIAVVFVSSILSVYSVSQAQSKPTGQLLPRFGTIGSDRTLNVFEGITVEFWISLSGTLSSDGEVAVLTVETGDVLEDDDTGQLTFPVEANTSSIYFSITTKRNLTATTAGQFTLTIQDNSDIGPFTPFHTMTVMVQNYDPPALTAEISPSINEGSNAVFNLSATLQPGGDTIPVKFTYTTTGNFLKDSTSLSNGTGTADVTFTTSNNTTTGSFSLETKLDNMHGTSGSISITLVANEYYTLGSPITTTVMIENIEHPEISITKEQSLTSVVEGGFFEIMLTASLRPDVPIPITLNISDNNLGYLSRFDPNPIMMPTTSDSLTVTVHIKVLPTINPSTNFRITVGQDTTNTNVNLRYTPKAGSSFVEVEILNSDKPVVQITSTANESSIVESSAFTFTLMVTPPPATDEVLSIPLTLEPTSTPYLDANLNLTYEVDSTGMLDVTVPTNLQAPDVDSVTIKLEIVSNPELYLIRDDYHKIEFGLIKVAETSKPIISITSDSDGESISEGQGFSFRLATFEPPTSGLEVHLTITDVSDFIEPDLSDSFTISTSGVFDKDVMTQADADSDEGGEINISIAEHLNYFISGRENQINITVQNISTVSISAGDGPHPEGSSITLTVTSSEPLTNSVTINIEVSEMDGDKILASSPQTFQVELTSANTTRIVSIRTRRNGVHMHGGSLTATVTTTSTDVLLAQDEISISVVDSDNPPSISISTEATSVTEGETNADGETGVEITLTAANSVSNIELPITLEIDDSTDHSFFEESSRFTETVYLPARMESVTHTITPQDDTVAERSGEFTVEVTSASDNTNYTVAGSPNHIISLQFIDDDIDDLPQLSVTAVEAEITEAGDDNNVVNASFKIAVDPDTTTSLTVRYEVTVLGNYLQNQGNYNEILSPTITFNTGEYMVDLPILNDMVTESRGNITFKLHYETANLTYRIDVENDTAEISVLDDDGGEELPKINISAEDSVVEGEKIIFTLMADPNATLPSSELTIILNITEIGNYLTNDTGEREVTLPAAGTTTYVEATSWRDESIRNGKVMAEILNESDPMTPDTYSIGTDFRVVVEVEVYRGPIISVTPPNASITAGRTAIFDISTSVPSTTSDLRVFVNVTQERDIILWRIPNIVTIPMGDSSFALNIPTRNMEFPEGMNGSITVAIQESESSNYRIRADTEAMVMVTSSESEENEPRISVADGAVNAILNHIQGTTEEVESASFGESSQPIVSIQTLNPVVLEGQSAQFLIGIQVVNSGDLVVNVKINGGQDFVNVSEPNQQVYIPSGLSRTHYTLATIDDERAEDDETITVSILAGESYSIADSPLNQASVLISDANDRAEFNQRLSAANRILIPELMATTGIQSYQTMSNRVQLAFNNEEQFLFEVGGQSKPTEILTLSGQTLNDQTNLMDMLRDDTEIAIRLTSDNSILNNTTAWLKSENQNFYNLTNTDANSWTGEFYTGNFGIDTQLDSGLLLGIATSTTENDISFSATSDQAFEYTASYTGFNPYIALNSPALNTQVWLSSNVSSGYVDVDSQHQRTHRLNSNYSAIIFGGESRLLSLNDLPFNGTSEFNLTGQGWLGQQHIYGDGRFTSDFTTKGHHVQISLAGNHKIDIAEIGIFNPNVLIGIRDTKKDADTVMGVEFGLGALYSNNFGLTLEGFGRGFKGSEQQDYATTFTSTLTYNPNQDNTGSQLTISPSWGQSTGQTQLSLWQSNLNRESELFDHYTNGLQIHSEYSYGIGFLDGVGILTPFSAINYSASDLMSFDIGNRIEIGTDSSFAIKGTREIRNNNITNNKIQLQGTVRW